MDASMRGPRSSQTKLSRRELLQTGGMSALTLGFPGTVVALVDSDRPPRGVAAEKSCIFLLMCGGPSHLDTWDLKPGAPEGIRGPYRPIATTVPGISRSCTRAWPSWPASSAWCARCATSATSAIISTPCTTA
jgi:hypothetical protein